MPEQYQNRELDVKFTEINDTLKRIETQTTRTNGKVAELQAWQSYLKGGLTVLSIIVVPILIYIIQHTFISK